MTNSQMMKPLLTRQFQQLPVRIYGTNQEVGMAAALEARQILSRAIETNRNVNVILATGNSQLSFLHALRELPGIDWAKVRIFHMDEYVGIDPDHPASFPRFLREHFVDHVHPAAFYPISGQADAVQSTCREYESLLRRYPADLVALGWGENGHLAFNDPPYAKFEDPHWVKVVELDEMSRKQQVGEGHFRALTEVPKQAITVTIPALLAAENILAIVPEARKAEAVRACLTEPISEMRPGSILRRVNHAQLYLDQDSAALLPA
jgi:glucosamine-6-phosphate deaminase